MAKQPETVVAGRKIFALAKMTPILLRETGFTEPGPTIVLDDGTVIYAAGDSERNQAGALFGESQGQSFHVYAIPELSKEFRGRVIRGTRFMTDAERQREGWQNEPAPLVLNIGIVQVWPSRDDEGNGPGTLHARLADGRHVQLELEGPKEWGPARS